uniref:preprotein translocase subunit SecY n=1 Tax=Chattonella marina TaxID=90936 RepID=UPI0021147017|nr:preprotein translocase subunit SecY [Chattonella marina]UTE94774.1 preprotein translocase subunit SecY [Chattonella marina]
MSLEENKNPFIKELDFYELNEKQIKAFSKDNETKTILTESARKKLITTCILIFLIRLGTYIPLPQIDKNAFTGIGESSLSVTNIINNFSGLNQLPSLFSLGIGPSINASIIMQLILAINPKLKKLQREEGEVGRRKVAQYTRYLTLVLSIVQSLFLTFSLRSFIFDFGFNKVLEISCLLTAGSMIVLWISEIITKSGITNGSSLLVFLNIIGNTPQQFKASLPYINFSQAILIITTLIITIAGVIVLEQSIRFIPIITSKISMQDPETGLKKKKTYFPFRLNQAGVMPIVFASYLLPVLASFGSFIILKFNNLNILPFSINFPSLLNQVFYFGFEFFLISLFTSFYSVLVIDPKDVSEDLQKAAFFIPGIRPGQQTYQYLDKMFRRQALIGGFILATNAVLLNFVGLTIKLPVLQGIGIGSQIIIVGVTIEVVRKIRALMISDVYKKYLKSEN